MNQQPSEALKRERMLLAIMTAVLVLAAVIGAAVFFGGRYVRVQQELDLGRKYVDELDYEQAVIHFTSAIDIDDRNVPAYLGRGEANLGLEEYEQAEADYTMVIETLQAESVEAYLGRAEAHDGQGETEEAEKDRQRAEELRENEKTESEPATILNSIRPGLKASQLVWVVEPTYDYKKVLPLWGDSFSERQGPYCDGTEPVIQEFREVSFPGYSALPQYYSVQLADDSWRFYYMPDHVDSGDIPAPIGSIYADYCPSGIFDRPAGEVISTSMICQPEPWNLLLYAELLEQPAEVYYDIYTQQGVLKGVGINYQPVAQAGLHKPYPAGQISTENTGVDATRTFTVAWDDTQFDEHRYWEVIRQQIWDYPKGYIGTDGQPITEFIYERAENFSEGLAACCIDGKWGYIDETGSPVTGFAYEGLWEKEVYDFNAGETDIFEAAFPCTCDTMVVRQNGKVGLLYRDGSVLIGFGEFEDMAPAFNNELWAKQGGRWGLIDLADAKTKAGLDPELSVPAKTETPEPQCGTSTYFLGNMQDNGDVMPDYPLTYEEGVDFFSSVPDRVTTAAEITSYREPDLNAYSWGNVPAGSSVDVLGTSSTATDWLYISWSEEQGDGTSVGEHGWVLKSELIP